MTQPSKRQRKRADREPNGIQNGAKRNPKRAKEPILKSIEIEVIERTANPYFPNTPRHPRIALWTQFGNNF